MTNIKQLREMILNGEKDEQLKAVYLTQEAVLKQRERYARVADEFSALFGQEREAEFFSAPGRTEIGGNHTDHNHGCVLAAGIDLDAIAVASKSEGDWVRVKSEGRVMDEVCLNDLEIKEEKFDKSEALVRGMLAGFKSRGYNIGAFDAATASDVLPGSGLSSSAAFEILLGAIINHLFNGGRVSAVEIAQIAQHAENTHFNKPCGLLDQTTSSVGGFVRVDFKDPENPLIQKVDFDFAKCGHALCVVDTGKSHSGLTAEYAAIKNEMKSAAEYFGKNVLREVNETEFKNDIFGVRAAAGDRAVLRSLHFYEENKRVEYLANALEHNDFEEFKKHITESGMSSFMYNQNVYANTQPKDQSLAIALALSETVLKGKGAWRVHGGGFAGTIQAFVPLDMLEEYKGLMESVFGENACYVLSVRPVGGAKVM